MNSPFDPLQYVSQRITYAQVMQIKTVFDLFDRDKGGQIFMPEIKAIINEIGMGSKADALYIRLNHIDMFTSFICFDEFFQLMTDRTSQNLDRIAIHSIFTTFDYNQTGFLSAKDLKRVGKYIGEIHDETALENMIKEADKDGDGYVSQEQFYNLMTKRTH